MRSCRTSSFPRAKPMDKDVMIRVEGLGKRYLLGQSRQPGRYTALRDVLAEAVKAPLRRLTKGRRADSRNDAEEFWALRNVNLEVRRGEVLGIVGRNGAGKSTLLKILSRITEPTAGRITLRGRVASLLEVGTGFHPELTGRENIFLNGAILGMERTEIKAKFDEIVAFAEVERFLDTPVKRYSSGMYVRLAFAVAAHLEPEILIVDEVLAVGDAAFQKKCIGKMQNIAHTTSRTVLFVSHNMGALTQLCDRCVLLDAGSLIAGGSPREMINLYTQSSSAVSEDLLKSAFRGPLSKTLHITDLYVGRETGEASNHIGPEEEIHIRISLHSTCQLGGFRTTLAIFAEGVRLFSLHDVDVPTAVAPGPFEARFILPPFFLRPGQYTIAAGGHDSVSGEWLWGTDLFVFSILEEWSQVNQKENTGVVNVQARACRR